jgi:ubiquinone/menaquinone biosynthesis C-methylase UbiE
LLKRVKTFQGSAFSIGLSANAVDCIFCLELFRHVPSSEGRLALLREFHRVSRDTVIVSVPSRTPWKPSSPGRFQASQPSGVPAGFRQWRVYVLRKAG